MTKLKTFVTWLAQAKVKRILGIIIMAGLLAFLGYKIYTDWQVIRKYTWQFDYRYILLGFIAYTFNLFSTGSIWGSIITRISGLKGRLLHIRWYSLTNLAQRLPTPIPFVGARAEAYASLGVPRTKTLTAMSLEVTITVLGAMVIAILTLPFSVLSSVELLKRSWLLLLLVPVVVVLIKPKWLFDLLGWILKKFKRTFTPPPINTKDMLIWTASFAVLWIVGGLQYYLLTRSIYPVEWKQLVVMVNVFALSGIAGWLGQFLFFVPLVAVRQIAVAYLLSFFLPWPVAVAVALITRLLSMVYEFFWASFFFLAFRKTIQNTIQKKKEEI